MKYDGTKLIYFDGKPQWLMPDGSFVPVRRRDGELYTAGALYLKDKAWDAPRLIAGRSKNAQPPNH
ncbi:MAG: hypothetical protein LBC93_02700 [Synergistaceae bacterium]|jgi:hypothetical protein|nr:hypothetical protein [Synergistaceae bacterium]